MGKPKTKRRKVWCPDQSRVDIDRRAYVRCPTCNRRLMPSEVCVYHMADTDEGKEHIGWKIPPHKVRRKVNGQG